MRQALRAHRGGPQHGMSRSPTYASWRAMRRRCCDPATESYPNYGGRGIRVCTAWASFAQFLADMGERPAGCTLDRKNPDGNYTPGNCRWSDALVQARTRRNSVGAATAAEIYRSYAAGGVMQKDIAVRYRISPSTVSDICRGRSYRGGAL